MRPGRFGRYHRHLYKRSNRPWSKPGAWRNRSKIVRLARLFRTRRPMTFNEKVRYKMMRDRRQLLVTWADKASMRDYVSNTVGSDYLPKAFHLLDEAPHLIQVDLPDAFVLKPTHGSGACVIVDTSAPHDARLPLAPDSWAYSHVRPEHVDRQQLVQIAGHWLCQRYGRGPNHEWAYGLAGRRLLVEELLRDTNGGIPQDYKLFVFHGQCRYVQVDGGRFGLRTQDFFTSEWQPLDMRGGFPQSVVAPARPHRLDEMLRLAETLGEETDFVRVDVYCLSDRVVVGELTSSPAGGDSPFHPALWNTTFGQPWNVPVRYR
jgi:hypothetical protein